MAFDDGALYVGARLYDTKPQGILSQLARRDRRVTADALHGVPRSPPRPPQRRLLRGQRRRHPVRRHLDERRLARRQLGRGVGERGGARRPGLDGGDAHPVFAAALQGRGRTGWGINFERVIARNNEHDLLAYTPRRGSGFVSRFPELQALGAIRPPRRIELSPYASFRLDNPGEAGDPFRAGLGHHARAWAPT